MKETIIQISITFFSGIAATILSLLIGWAMCSFRFNVDYKDLITGAWLTLIFVVSILCTLIFYYI